MSQFLIAATALTIFAATAAQADSINGAPLQKGNQCFIYSKGNDKDARFGSWGACPQTASAPAASAATTPRTTRRATSR
jgi:hypothetical protein